jgi:cation diffusion facilitator CzcD-associated flavoprotein CzcO
MTCSFLFANTGYYRYDEGYAPSFPGRERFRGPVVHPQHWPEDLDYSGKRVVVIGSGATAVTLVPAMAETAAHVTMLQRSPSYVFAVPGADPLADAVRRILPPRLAYPLVRWKNTILQAFFYRLCRRFPDAMRRSIRRGVARQLPVGYDVETHFEPRYQPWDQRVCFVPDGDLFAAISAGRASVVTGRIEELTEHGVRLTSGEELEADIIVSATGLNLLFMGGISLSVDGRPIEPGNAVAYKGMMLSGVPNLAFTVGYTNASWTLKADLVARYVCRLLRRMEAGRHEIVTPRDPGPDVGIEPIFGLTSGYVLRSADILPRQGGRIPWRLHQNYFKDVVMLRLRDVEDEGVELSRPTSPSSRSAELLAA